MPLSPSLRTAALVFALTSLGYLLSAAGYVDHWDAKPSIDTARALVERGSLAVLEPVTPSENFTFYMSNEWGRFSKMGIIHPLLYVLPVLLGKAAHSVGFPERTATDILVSLVNSVLTALMVALLFLWFERRGQPRKTAIALALVAGFATSLWPYAKTCLREPAQALCLVIAYLAAGTDLFPRRMAPWITGTSIAAAFLCKQALILPGIPVLAYALIRYSHMSLRTWLGLVVPVGIAGALHLLYWSVLMHRFYPAGYGERVLRIGTGAAWSTPFLKGLYLQWLDPRYALFLYSPAICLLALLCWSSFRRTEGRDGPLVICVGLSVLWHSGLHAMWEDPLGGAYAGSRFLGAILPLLLMLASELDWRRVWSSKMKAPVVVLLMLSVSVQIVQVSVKLHQYPSMKALTRNAKSDSWIAPWRANTLLFAHKLSGEPEKYRATRFGGPDTEIDLHPHRSLHGVNFWWAHAYRRWYASAPATRRYN